MRKLAVAAGAVALMAVGGVALAQTTGDERIYACVNNGDGTIRQVASATTACSKGWHKLSWSAENAPAEALPVTTTYSKDAFWSAPPSTTSNQTVTCNDGDVATGGGYVSLASLRVLRSHADNEGGIPVGWTVQVLNTDTVGYQPIVTVVCQHTE